MNTRTHQDSLAESRELAHAINATNAQRISRVEQRVNAAVSVILALVLAVIGAALLVHWLTPCEAGTLCMGAAVTPTRRGVRAWCSELLALAPRRLAGHAQAAYLRWLLRAHENDVRALEEQMQLAQWELDHLPQQMRLHRQHMATLRCRLAALEAAKPIEPVATANTSITKRGRA